MIGRFRSRRPFVRSSTTLQSGSRARRTPASGRHGRRQRVHPHYPRWRWLTTVGLDAGVDPTFPADLLPDRPGLVAGSPPEAGALVGRWSCWRPAAVTHRTGPTRRQLRLGVLSSSSRARPRRPGPVRAPGFVRELADDSRRSPHTGALRCGGGPAEHDAARTLSARMLAVARRSTTRPCSPPRTCRRAHHCARGARRRPRAPRT